MKDYPLMCPYCGGKGFTLGYENVHKECKHCNGSGEELDESDTDQKRREPGYYWVKYSGKWVIGEWYYFPNSIVYGWLLPDGVGPFKDDRVDEIDERRIEREPRPKPDVIAIEFARYMDHASVEYDFQEQRTHSLEEHYENFLSLRG